MFAGCHLSKTIQDAQTRGTHKCWRLKALRRDLTPCAGLPRANQTLLAVATSHLLSNALKHTRLTTQNALMNDIERI